VTKDDLDFFAASDILNDTARIKEIIGSGIFTASNARNPLTKSAFTEVMICLRDLLRKTETYGTRISFTDDMVTTSQMKDVTDLVKFMRDALCHSHIFNHWVVHGTLKASFITLYGKRSYTPFTDHPGIVFESAYDDDVCFFFGLQQIYLRRHIVRAVKEARKQLFPLPKFPDDVLTYGPPD
jgi:hypothetical protein